MNRRYKVLPLPNWAKVRSPIFERTFLSCIETCSSIEPVFNRDGFYFDRQTGQTWIERLGRAWIYRDRCNFQWELDHNIGNNRIEIRIYDAIKILVDEGMAGNELAHLYEIETYFRYIRSCQINGMRLRLRIRQNA